MNTRMLSNAFLLTLIMILATVGPALALQPEIAHLQIHRHWDDFAVCDGYNVIGDENSQLCAALK